MNGESKPQVALAISFHQKGKATAPDGHPNMHVVGTKFKTLPCCVPCEMSALAVKSFPLACFTQISCHGNYVCYVKLAPWYTL